MARPTSWSKRFSSMDMGRAYTGIGRVRNETYRTTSTGLGEICTSPVVTLPISMRESRPLPW